MADLELLKTYATVEVRAAKYESDMNALKRKTEDSTKKMQTSWNRIGKAVERNAAQIRKTGIAVAAVGTAITGSLLLAVRSATKLGDELDKMSLRTGESVETLSALSFAAQISGSSIQQMENGIRRLSRNMNDFQNGIGEAARAFDKLGVSVTDSSGNLRSASSFIIEVADKFNQLTSSSEQAAVAQEIFGRGGTAMLPLLKQGSAGIKALTDRAAELGLVLSTEAATAAALFNDRITELTSSLKLATAKLGAELIPTLQPLVENITEIIGKISRWTEANRSTTKGVLTLSLALGGVLTVAGSLLLILPSLAAGVALIGGAPVLVPIAAFVAAFAGLAAIVVVAKEKAQALKRAVDNLTKSAKAFTQVDFAEGVKGAVEAFDDLGDKIKDVRGELERLQPQMAMLGVPGLERIRELEEALARLSTEQARLITPVVGDPNIMNRIKALNDLTASLREASRATFFLRGEPAPRTRMPIVREQLIPVPTEGTISAFREFWNKIKRIAELAAIEANKRLLQIETDRLKETLDRNDAAFSEMKERAIQATLDETEGKLAITGAYYDLIYDIAKKNEERISKFRRDISKSVIDDMLEADRERREKDLEASAAHATKIAELWDGVAETISSSLESMFSDVLSGNLKTWEDFWSNVWGIAQRGIARLAASQVSKMIRSLLPGGEQPGALGLDTAASELAIATTALVPATVALSGAAGSLMVAAALIAGTGVVGGGGVTGLSGEGQQALSELQRETSGGCSVGSNYSASAPARQMGGLGVRGGGDFIFKGNINITAADLETMSQAKVNSLFERKLLPAMVNAAQKGKINKSMMGG